MSEDIKDLEKELEEGTEDNSAPQEIELLKARADKLGVPYSNNIGVDKLKERINAHLAGLESDSKKEEEKPAKPSKHSERQKSHNEAMKMVRVRLALMNQRKSDMPGEIISFANDVVGIIKYFVPYDDAAYENGYHLPNCVVKFLQGRKFLQTKNVRDPDTKRMVTKSAFVKEYEIVILPDLTPAELEALAARQTAHNAID